MKLIDDETLRVTIGPQHADCQDCPLYGPCRSTGARAVHGERPESWEPGGLMIIGEGPGKLEASQGRPFVGPSGQLLSALLEASGIDRHRCWITNATMGLPPYVPDKKAKATMLSEAVYHCLPRLEREIEEARPGVILTLGRYAFAALYGSELRVNRQVPNPCTYVRCDPKDRKVGPVISCSKCGWFTIGDQNLEALLRANPRKLAPELKEWAEEVKETYGGECPQCGASIKRMRPKRAKCPQCGGRKQQVVEVTKWESGGFNVVGREGVAGAVFRADELPSRLDEFGVRYVIPTYHPSFLLRPVPSHARYCAGQYAARAWTDHATKARKLLTEEPDFEVTPTVTKDPEELRTFLSASGRYAVDIETNFKGNVYDVTCITVIGFARADSTEVMVVDTRDITKEIALRGGSDRQNELLDVMDEFFLRKDAVSVWHNGVYDRTAMALVWGLWVENAEDTMVAHNALYPNEEHNLGFVGHELTDAPHWKSSDDTETWNQDAYHPLSGYRTFEGLVKYNAKDTRVTALADEIMMGDGEGRKGRVHVEKVDAAYQVDLRNWDLALRMRLAGLPLNKKQLGIVEDTHVKVIDEELAWMRDFVGNDEFAPTAPKQLAWALFDPMGPCALPVLKRTPKGAPSTAKDALAQLVGKNAFVSHLLKFREYSKRLSTYIRGKGLVFGDDGRIHPQWKPGLVTGRWSSSPNLQNWPYLMRSCVIAPPGRVLVGADYAQLEMRIMASLSNDETLIDLCANADESRKLEPDYDPHSYVARMVFGDSFTKLSLADPNHDADAKKRGHTCKCQTCERKMLRDIVKRVVYGLNYGAGAATIVAAIYDGGYDGPELSTSFIEKVVVIYFDTFPGVPKWRDRQWKHVYAEREVRSPLHKRRRIFPLQDVDVAVAYNYPIQSGGADIVNWRAWELDRVLRDVDPSADIIAQVHDAVYVECDEDRAEEVRQLVEDTLSVEFSLLDGARPMPYPAAAEIGKSWDKV